jgi:hypothetical protein
LGTVVVPGEYTVPGIAPAGAAVPAGVVRVPGTVLLGTVPTVVPGCPVTTPPGVPGVAIAPGVMGTVWANAAVLVPSPSRAAKINPVVFIRKVRIG